MRALGHGWLRVLERTQTYLMILFACLCLSLHVFACLCISLPVFACLCLCLRSVAPLVEMAVSWASMLLLTMKQRAQTRSCFQPLYMQDQGCCHYDNFRVGSFQGAFLADHHWQQRYNSPSGEERWVLSIAVSHPQFDEHLAKGRTHLILLTSATSASIPNSFCMLLEIFESRSGAQSQNCEVERLYTTETGVVGYSILPASCIYIRHIHQTYIYMYVCIIHSYVTYTDAIDICIHTYILEATKLAS